MDGMRGPISRTFVVDDPLTAGIWVADHSVVVAVNGRLTVALHHHLEPDAGRVLATMVAEASEWLDPTPGVQSTLSSNDGHAQGRS